MSREGAYRLKRRPTAKAFAAAWDRILAAPPAALRPGHEGHGRGHEGHTAAGAAPAFHSGKGHNGHAAAEPRSTGNRVN